MKAGTQTGPPITSYIHPDHLGSTNVVTNASGTVTQLLDYFPYGASHISQNNSSGNIARQYIGQFTDTTGLDYLNARYYDSARGQFMSEDPVFWEIGQTNDGKQALIVPEMQNAYGYSNNNPIVNRDPSGRCGTPVTAAICAFFMPNVAGDPVFNKDGTISATPQQKKLEGGMLIAGFIVPGGEAKNVETISEEAIQTGLQAAKNDAAKGIYKPLSNYVGDVSAQSYVALKKVIGSARDSIGDGFQWHHIVEQNAENVSTFGQEAIQSTRNIIALPRDIHQEISSVYSSSNGLGQTLRESISKLPYSEQLSAGMQIVSGIINKVK